MLAHVAALTEQLHENQNRTLQGCRFSPGFGLCTYIAMPKQEDEPTMPLNRPATQPRLYMRSPQLRPPESSSKKVALLRVAGQPARDVSKSLPSMGTFSLPQPPVVQAQSNRHSPLCLYPPRCFHHVSRLVSHLAPAGFEIQCHKA